MVPQYREKNYILYGKEKKVILDIINVSSYNGALTQKKILFFMINARVLGSIKEINNIFRLLKWSLYKFLARRLGIRIICNSSWKFRDNMSRWSRFRNLTLTNPKDNETFLKLLNDQNESLVCPCFLFFTFFAKKTCCNLLLQGIELWEGTIPIKFSFHQH